MELSYMYMYMYMYLHRYRYFEYVYVNVYVCVYVHVLHTYIVYGITYLNDVYIYINKYSLLFITTS